MTTFEVKKSSNQTAKALKVPKLKLGCNLQNTMPWALNSTNNFKKTRKQKKLKHYELNTKSRELKLREKKPSESSGDSSMHKPRKVLKLSKFNDYINGLKTLRANLQCQVEDTNLNATVASNKFTMFNTTEEQTHESDYSDLEQN